MKTRKEFQIDAGSVASPEVWRDIPGYEGFYQASSLGRVRSVPRYVNGPRGKPIFLKGRIMRPAVGPNGYLHFVASKHGEVTTISVHRAVAMAFIANDNAMPVINHKNGNKLENYPSNLQWVSSSDNNEHALDVGLRKDVGERSFHAKLSMGDVKKIIQLSASGVGSAELATTFGVTRRNINHIISGGSWVRALSADNDNVNNSVRENA